MKISTQQIAAVTALPGPERYSHFIKRVVDSEQVWGLYGDVWALAATAAGEQVLPLWPAPEYAQLCAQGAWQNHNPRAVSLDELVEDFLPYLKQNNTLPAIFYTLVDTGVVPSFEQLERDLAEESRNYE